VHLGGAQIFNDRSGFAVGSVERLFCRLKNWRRLATRYDRLARNYLAALALVATVTEWT
jgi:transposase